MHVYIQLKVLMNGCVKVVGPHLRDLKPFQSCKSNAFSDNITDSLMALCGNKTRAMTLFFFTL